jgi:DNA polymerase III delta prime subunit
LQDICDFENLQIDSQALGTLSRVAQGDIRACINALQVWVHSS